MRVFLAIYPPKHVRDYFRDVIRGLDKEKRNLRAIELEQMHLNIRFIGAKVHPGSKDVIVRELLKQAGSFPKPEIKLTRLQLGFRHQHNPRVVFSKVKRNDELDELVDRLHKTIRGLKRMDTIQWKQKHDHDYHISITRLKPSATRSSGRNVSQLIKDLELEMPEPFIAEEMFVVQSEIKRQSRPVYRTLERIPL